WAVLALVCSIELLTQAHYRQSIEPDAELSELWKDVFMLHWREESQHASLDELEWVRAGRALTAAGRERSVADLPDRVAARDGIRRAQAAADATCFEATCAHRLSDRERQAVQSTVLRAYRWQYIGSGVTDERFQKILRGMIDERQLARLGEVLAPMLQ